MKKLEELLEWGGLKKDIICLVIAGSVFVIINSAFLLGYKRK